MSVYATEVEGYRVMFYPPARSTASLKEVEEHDVTVNDVSAYQADLIKLEFVKQDFNRKHWKEYSDAGCQDPPLTLIQRMVDSYVLRMRHVLKAPAIRLFDISGTVVKVTYLNDDETELQDEKDCFRGLLRFAVRGHYVGMDASAWEDFNSLPIDFHPQPWEPLLLDAEVKGTPVGSAVVLVAAALEVFITRTIDRLAKEKVSPVEFWEWATDGRDHYQKEPSVSELFDKLLLVFCGHSLKEEQKLWQIHRNIRKARNNFVHRGIPAVADDSLNPITDGETKALIDGAKAIIAKVRGWLPAQLHWQELNHDIRVTWARPLFTFDRTSGNIDF